MLTLSTIECGLDDEVGTAGAAEYVLSRDDGSAAFAGGAYYADGEPDDDRGATWFGAPQALDQLGAVGDRAVSRDELIAALTGRHIATGEQVRRPGVRTIDRVDGSTSSERVVKSVDMTFSVPKSVSVVWSQASPAERAAIEADVLAAAQETVDFMATRKGAIHRRLPGGGRVREPAMGVAAALSLHVTARRADADVAPAPQLHVHAVVVGLLRQDGRLVSPDPWNWYRHGAAREGGAYGRAVLADRLRQRGYSIETDTGKHGRYFELRGVPQSLRTALSGRSREVAIRARALELATGRRASGAALAVIAKETRQEKDPELDQQQVAAWWDAVSAEHGFGPEDAQRLRARTRERDRKDDERELVMAILRKLSDEGPTVSSAEARAITYEAAAGRALPDHVEVLMDRLIEQGTVIPLQQDRVTTKSIRELERTALTAARDAGRREPAPLQAETVAAAVKQAEGSLGNGKTLDTEQRAAVETICGGSGWSNLTGRAGTGKGPTLEAVAHAHRGEGWQVLATAVDGTTAQRLAAQVHGRGCTIDSLLYRVATQRLLPDERTLVIVDEASKVDTARWAELGKLADDGVRVLAVGDTGQLDAIQLSGLFAEIVKRTPTVELDTIRRHRDAKDPSREHAWLGRYQAALHAGRGADAVAILREHDAIKLHDSRAEAMVKLVENWDSWRHDHPLEQTMLLVHGTNGDVDTVNHLAQKTRRDAGELSDQTVAAPDRDYQLHAGDLAVVRGAPIYLPPDQGGGRIENGTTIHIDQVDERLDRLTARWDHPDAGRRTAQLDLAPLRRDLPGIRRPAIRLAYAQHPNPAQGATVERTATLGHPVADRKAVYVADTRAKHDHTVHLAREDLGLNGTDEDRLARYAESISESRTSAASVRFHRRTRTPDGGDVS